jgi:hypothetical protein
MTGEVTSRCVRCEKARAIGPWPSRCEGCIRELGDEIENIAHAFTLYVLFLSFGGRLGAKVAVGPRRRSTAA